MIQLPWLVPSVRGLTTKDIFVVFRKLSERFERRGILGYQGTLFEFFLEVDESMVFSELSSISHELIMRDSIERIRELGADEAVRRRRLPDVLLRVKTSRQYG